MRIINYPNKILREKSKNIKQISSSKIQGFIPLFIDLMIKHDGIGLSAPQVGLNINLIAVNFQEGVKVLINPRICWKNWFKKNVIEEGCLSFPGIFGFVKRPFSVWVKYRDAEGKIMLEKFSGLAATVVQHEIDHLRGVLFIDKIIKFTRGEKYFQSLKLNANNEEK